MINPNTLRLILLYVICIALQQALKNAVPIDHATQIAIALHTPPVIWLILKIIKDGHKY